MKLKITCFYWHIPKKYKILTSIYLNIYLHVLGNFTEAVLINTVSVIYLPLGTICFGPKKKNNNLIWIVYIKNDSENMLSLADAKHYCYLWMYLVFQLRQCYNKHKFYFTMLCKSYSSAETCISLKNKWRQCMKQFKPCIIYTKFI